MVKKIITKAQIIKALETEPLVAEKWVQNNNLNFKGSCGVCAVGAVLRSACKLKNNEIEDGAHSSIGEYGILTMRVNRATANNVSFHINNGEYMLALSEMFESMMAEVDEVSYVNDVRGKKVIFRKATAAEMRANDAWYYNVDETKRPLKIEEFRVATKAHRRKLILFVKKNFPVKIELQLPEKDSK